MDNGILNEAINLSHNAIGRARETFRAQRPIREMAEEVTRFVTHQSFKRKLATGGIAAGTGLLAMRARTQHIGASSGAQGSPNTNASGSRYNMYNGY